MLKDEEVLEAAAHVAAEFGRPYNDQFEVTVARTDGDIITINFNDRRSSARPGQEVFSIEVHREASVEAVKEKVRERLSQRLRS
jgi:hypothetical protein